MSSIECHSDLLVPAPEVKSSELEIVKESSTFHPPFIILHPDDLVSLLAYPHKVRVDGDLASQFPRMNLAGPRRTQSYDSLRNTLWCLI